MSCTPSSEPRFYRIPQTPTHRPAFGAGIQTCDIVTSPSIQCISARLSIKDMRCLSSKCKKFAPSGAHAPQSNPHHALLQTGHNFLLAHRRAGRFINTEWRQNDMRRKCQQTHKGLCNRGNRGHRSRRQYRNRLGMELPYTHRNQFAEDNRYKCNSSYDDRHCRNGGNSLRYSQPYQPNCLPSTEGSLAKMPLGSPMEVIPTCMDDRNGLGFSSSSSAACTPLPSPAPKSAILPCSWRSVPIPTLQTPR